MPGSMLILTWVSIIVVKILHLAFARCKIMTKIMPTHVKMSIELGIRELLLQLSTCRSDRLARLLIVIMYIQRLWLKISTPHVTPVVLLLNDMNITWYNGNRVGHLAPASQKVVNRKLGRTTVFLRFTTVSQNLPNSDIRHFWVANYRLGRSSRKS
jgi:predicted small integral membrane protein